MLGNVSKLDCSWRHRTWTECEKSLWSYIEQGKRRVHVGGSLRGELSSYSPAFWKRKILGDPTDSNKMETIFLMSRVKWGRTFMVWEQGREKLSAGSESPPGCWWVESSKGGQGFQLERHKKTCCCKALNSCFYLVGRPHSQPHVRLLERICAAARGGGRGVSRFLVRDQIRLSAEEEQWPRIHENWMPTLTWLLPLLCELEQAPNSPGWFACEIGLGFETKSWHTLTMPCVNTSPKSFRDITSCNSPQSRASGNYYSPL